MNTKIFVALATLIACLLTVPVSGQERERDVRRERERRESREKDTRSNEKLDRENDKLGKGSERLDRESDKLSRNNDRLNDSKSSGKDLSREGDRVAKEDIAKRDAAKANGGYDLSSLKNDPERSRRVEQSLRDMNEGKKNYNQDLTVFENREKRLPEQSQGYYREYTVKPAEGVTNRGAERLVKGEKGEVYYSRDHYDNFTRLK